jgi:hypothetical protein
MAALTEKAWRLGFLFGITAFILSLVANYGFGTTTQVASLISLIVTVLNSIGGPSPTDKKDWVKARARRLLAITPLLKLATIVVWIVAAGLLGQLVRARYSASQQVTIAGKVTTATGEPAPLAVVSVVSRPDFSVTTETDGTFTLPVDRRTLELPFDLEATWQLLRSKNQRVASWGNVTNLTILLPPAINPLRTTYFRFSPPAAYMMLRGRFPAKLEAHFRVSPAVVENDVARFARELITRYTVTLEPQIDILRKQGDDDMVPTAQEVRTALEGRLPVAGDDGTPVWTAGLEPAQIRQLLGETGWSYWFGEAGSELDQLTLWRPLKTRDLNLFSENPTHVAYVRKLLANGVAADFSILQLTVDACAGGVVATLLMPELELELATIENTSASTVEINAGFAVGDELRIRAYDTDEKTLADARASKFESLRQLKPNEMVAVPLAVNLRFVGLEPPEVLAEMNAGAVTDPEKQRELFETLVKRPIVLSSLGENVSVSADLLRRAVIGPAAPTLVLERAYRVGPSLRLVRAEVNRVSHDFRQADWQNVQLFGSFEGGSCPRLYSHDSRGRHDQGTILDGIVGARHERADSVRLTSYNGTLSIREEDPETTYLRDLHVAALAPDGRVVRIPCASNGTAKRDKDHFILRTGDELVFNCGAPISGATHFAVAKGYYVPNRRAMYE